MTTYLVDSCVTKNSIVSDLTAKGNWIDLSLTTNSDVIDIDFGLVDSFHSNCYLVEDFAHGGPVEPNSPFDCNSIVALDLNSHFRRVVSEIEAGSKFGINHSFAGLLQEHSWLDSRSKMVDKVGLSSVNDSSTRP